MSDDLPETMADRHLERYYEQRDSYQGVTYPHSSLAAQASDALRGRGYTVDTWGSHVTITAEPSKAT